MLFGPRPLGTTYLKYTTLNWFAKLNGYKYGIVGGCLGRYSDGIMGYTDINAGSLVGALVGIPMGLWDINRGIVGMALIILLLLMLSIW